MNSRFGKWSSNLREQSKEPQDLEENNWKEGAFYQVAAETQVDETMKCQLGKTEVSYASARQTLRWKHTQWNC